MNINRRNFLASIGSGIALALAGCTANASCDDLAVDDATHTIYASREEIFIDIDDGSDETDPNTIPDSTLQLIKKAIGAGQEFTPVTESMDFDPDNEGPQTGFFIHEDTELDWVKEAFENGGIDVDYDWWKNAENSVDWNQINEVIQTRYEAAENFTATEHSSVTLPGLDIRPTGKGDVGEQATWNIYDAESEDEATAIINAVNRPTGLAVAPRNPQYTDYYDIVDPDEFIEDVDVVTSGEGDDLLFEVRAELNQDAVDNYVQDAPDSIDALRFDTSTPIALHYNLIVDDGDTPVASTMTETWDAAYGIATAYAAPLKNPIYTNGDMASCTEADKETENNSE